MTASSTYSDLRSAPSARHIVAGLCALTLVIFLPFNQAVIDPGPMFAGFRKYPFGYARILLPHVVTLVSCLLAGGSRTFRLAMGVGFIASLALGITVPVLWLLTSGLSSERGNAAGILLWGIVLFATQIQIYRTARRALDSTRPKGRNRN
jgi:hypothetical protein